MAQENVTNYNFYAHQLQVRIVIKEEASCGNILVVTQNKQAELHAHLGDGMETH